MATTSQTDVRSERDKPDVRLQLATTQHTKGVVREGDQPDVSRCHERLAAGLCLDRPSSFFEVVQRYL